LYDDQTGLIRFGARDYPEGTPFGVMPLLADGQLKIRLDLWVKTSIYIFI
jgi:hypothetical protein